MQVVRWVLAVFGWLAPNVLLLLALGSIPRVENHTPDGSPADWIAGFVVFPSFFAIFFAVGMLSIRLALHAAPESGRPGLARTGRWGSLAWLALCLAIVAFDATPEQEMGSACFVLWGLGHLLGSRWKIPPIDRGN